MNPLQQYIRARAEEFEKKVNELRREVGWGTSEDSPTHEFGYKTVRKTDGYTELFVVPDWGNIKSFHSTTIVGVLEKLREMVGEDEENDRTPNQGDFYGQYERNNLIDGRNQERARIRSLLTNLT